MSLFTLHQQSAWKRIELDQLDAAQAEHAKSIVDGLGEIVKRHDERKVSANTNPDLSETGRQAAHAQTSKTAGTQIENLTGAFLSGLRDKAGTLASSIANKVSTTPTMADHLLMIERRGQAEKIDALERYPAYLQLCRNGNDDLSCLAMENASGLHPLLSPAAIAEGKAIRGARLAPDAQAELDKVHAMHESIGMLANVARRETGHIGDTLSEQASGQKPVAINGASA